MSKIKNGGLDRYGAEPFEQQQFGTAGVEGVNNRLLSQCRTLAWYLDTPCTAHESVATYAGIGARYYDRSAMETTGLGVDLHTMR